MARFLKPLTLLILGGYLYSLILHGTVNNLVDGRVSILILSSAIVLFLMAIAYWRTELGAQTTTTQSVSAIALLLVLLPVIVGILAGNPAAEHETAEIVYLNWDEQGFLQLYKTTAAGAAPQQLTHVKNNTQVTNFAISPDGDFIAYTVQNNDRSSDIWTIDRQGQLPYPVLDCLSAACSNPVWTPDGTRIMYERRPVDLPDRSRLWWLDPLTGDSIPVFNDDSVLGYGVQFSPNGRWFSFLSPQEQQILIYNLQTAAITTIASQTGEEGAWHPSADYFYFTDVRYLGTTITTHIFQADLQSGEEGELSNLMAAVNDGSLAWAPNGRYLAFGRQPTRVASGKQLWLMPSSGDPPRQLTDTPTINHGLPTWSPDSQLMAYQAFDTTQPQSDPAIWVVDVANGRTWEVAPAGIMPQWLP